MQVRTAISGGVDISEVRWCHFLRQMSSQRLMSLELTAYLSIFNLFKLN